jgi:hypothetical protein
VLSKQLEEEYKLLRTQEMDYRRSALVIKGWVTAGMFVVISKFDLMSNAGIAFGAIVLALAAWFFEAIWKSWESANNERIHAIEAYFAGGGDLQPFQMSASWNKQYAATPILWVSFKRAKHQGLTLFVMLPYLPFIAVCVAYVIYVWCHS